MGGFSGNSIGENQSFIQNNGQPKKPLKNLETKIRLNELKGISKKALEDLIVKSVNHTDNGGECRINPNNNFYRPWLNKKFDLELKEVFFND